MSTSGVYTGICVIFVLTISVIIGIAMIQNTTFDSIQQNKAELDYLAQINNTTSVSQKYDVMKNVCIITTVPSNCVEMLRLKYIVKGDK